MHDIASIPTPKMPSSCNHTIHKAQSHYGWDNAFAHSARIAGKDILFADPIHIPVHYEVAYAKDAE